MAKAMHSVASRQLEIVATVASVGIERDLTGLRGIDIAIWQVGVVNGVEPPVLSLCHRIVGWWSDKSTLLT